jgi:PAS domain S-box-containing protein
MNDQVTTSRTGPSRLLVVEDNAAEARLLQLQLERSNPSRFQLVFAVNLEQALEALRTIQIEVILLDLFLPDSRGLETLHHVQKFAPHVPTIVLTSLDDEEVATGALRAGAQDFVVKGKGELSQLDRAIRYAIERKRIEEQLRVLSRTVEQSPVSIMITDTTGAIEYVNPRFSQITGYTPDEVRGRNARILKSSENPASLYRDMWHTIVAGGEWRGELCNTTKSGVQIWEAMTISPIRNAAGDVTHFVALKEDITDRRRSDLTLQRARKMEGVQSVLSGIAQNFNNILNNVLGFALLVKKYSSDPAKIVRYAEVIEQSAGRGAQLTERLLALTVDEQMPLEEVRLPDVISDALLRLSPDLPPSITMVNEVQKAISTVYANEQELVAALTHLLRNAVEAMVDADVAGTITVSASDIDGAAAGLPSMDHEEGMTWVGIHVADRGPGIPPEIRDRVFDPLYTTKDQARHPGLGLSQVYNTTRRHRGIVTLESVPGSGTVFHLYLPAKPRIAPVTMVAPPSYAGKGELVLLVDDEPAMREFGREILSEVGYRVMVAKNGKEAVDIFREHTGEIDLVVLDLIMPHMDGGQAFLEMKKLRGDVRACFCTGFTSDQVITSLLEEENLKAIKKPFQPEEFLQIVRQTIDRS